MDTTDRSSSQPFNVVIAGGSVAALEAAFALRDLAGENVHVTLVAPNTEFVYRPMSVREPFALGAAGRCRLAKIANDIGVELITDSLSWLDAAQRVVHIEGAARLKYDALLLALGARPRRRYPHAVTLDDARLDDILHGLIQDIEGGYVRHVAFVIPGEFAWPLPVYELALMTAGRAHDMNIDLAVTIITPEANPLAVFGDGASSAVARLLHEHAITTITSARCEVPHSRQVVINPGDRRLEADRVVVLPELRGPSVRGLKAGFRGFIPVDAHCKVRGVERVYAAGDATDFAVKHGGIAAQQADTAARAIAALAGVDIDPKPLDPVIRGILLTGGKPRYLTAHLIAGHSSHSQISDTPTWSPPTKIAARYLAPYLDEHGVSAPIVV
jgi:sulfide:quinone oxidoreductase